MAAESVKTIFFDLDNTLFDHTRAEHEALRETIALLPETERPSDIQAFLRTYNLINNELWRQMARGDLKAGELKIQRLQKTFEAHNLPPADFAALSRSYLTTYTSKKFTMPNARAVLKYLFRRYDLGILSNGFTEIQRAKLSNLQLSRYFKYTVFSEDAGAMKPSSKIFDAALSACGCRPSEVVYVGDSYDTDIVGAQSAGWHAVHITKAVTSEQNGPTCLRIADLMELTSFFADN
jgi:YjjG family noncanonical pyrimidine nucleotidase